MKIVKNLNVNEAEQNNERIEKVKEFTCLETLITNNYDDIKEIRRRLGIARYGLVNKHMERQKYYYYYSEETPTLVSF